MQVINLTGHEIRELKSGHIYPPNGPALRIEADSKFIFDVNGASVDRVRIRRTDLPPVAEGTVYIVSQLTLNAVPDYRQDIIAPKKVIKDRQGNIIGCRGFRCK